MIQMFDTITIDTVPPNPQAVAGYVNGKWPTYQSLLTAFPRAFHLSIAVNTSADAECLDIEPLDATPAQAPAWVKRQLARGVKRPVVYASVSSMDTVLNELAVSGIARNAVRIWTAHFTDVPHLCTPGCGFGLRTTADATQWTSHALGRNLDESLCQDEFFITPPPPDILHYDWFDQGPFPSRFGPLNERAIVQRYDELRKHPVIYSGQLLYQRRRLTWLADRVYAVAHRDLINCKPSWGLFHRGWRYQMLRQRSEGKRFA